MGKQLRARDKRRRRKRQIKRRKALLLEKLAKLGKSTTSS